MHALTQEDLDAIEDGFGIPRGGPWNRFAVTYVGLSFPLFQGWKLRLLRDGASDDSPLAKGVSYDDWRWLHADIDEPADRVKPSRNVDPHRYALLRVDSLEMVLNELIRQTQDVKREIKEIRELLSKDDW